MNLTGPPFPYTQQDAEEWIEARVPESDDILKDLKEHFEGSVGREENVPVGPTGLKLVEGCPLSVIREVREDGTDIYIGSIGLIRSKFFDIVDPVEKEQAIQENDARPLGDPDIIRSFGGKHHNPIPATGNELSLTIAMICTYRFLSPFAPRKRHNDSRNPNTDRQLGDPQNGCAKDDSNGSERQYRECPGV